jgi:hypothetical protein
VVGVVVAVGEGVGEGAPDREGEVVTDARGEVEAVGCEDAEGGVDRDGGVDREGAGVWEGEVDVDGGGDAGGEEEEGECEGGSALALAGRSTLASGDVAPGCFTGVPPAKPKTVTLPLELPDEGGEKRARRMGKTKVLSKAITPCFATLR